MPFHAMLCHAVAMPIHAMPAHAHAESRQQTNDADTHAAHLIALSKLLANLHGPSDAAHHLPIF